MRYGTVPGVDKEISKIVLGTAGIGRMEQSEVDAICDRFVELGGNAFDTAYIYGGGRCTERLGNWLRRQPDRDRFVLLVKGCHPDQNGSTFTTEHLEAHLRVEMERLHTDYTDLWVFHRDDPSHDLAPILKKLDELRKEGRLFAVGGSNWQIERIEEANRIAEELGIPGLALNNPNLSLAEVNEPMWEDCVTVDEEMRRWHERHQFPLFSWSSTGGGYFVGAESEDITRVYQNEANRARKDRAQRLALEKGVSPIQIVLAYTLNHPFPVWALCGCRSPQEVEENLAAVDLTLTSDELAYLERGE